MAPSACSSSILLGGIVFSKMTIWTYHVNIAESLNAAILEGHEKPILACLSTCVIIPWDGVLNADNSIPMFRRPKLLSLALSRKFSSSHLGRHDLTILSQLTIR